MKDIEKFDWWDGPEKLDPLPEPQSFAGVDRSVDSSYYSFYKMQERQLQETINLLLKHLEKDYYG